MAKTTRSRAADDGTTCAFRLLRYLLEGNVLSVQGAVQLLETTEKTCERGLERLAADLPDHVEVFRQRCEQSGRQSRHWRLRPMADDDGVRTRQRLVALAVADMLCAPLRETAIAATLADMVGEQLRGLDLAQGDLSRRLRARRLPFVADGFDADAFDRTVAAVFDTKTLRFSYANIEGKRRDWEIEPLTLFLANDTLYVYGRVCDGPDKALDRRMQFAVSRIQDPAAGQRFRYPLQDEYDPVELWRPSFSNFGPGDGLPVEDVVLQFAPHWRSILESHPIHGSQRLGEPSADNWLTVHIQVYVQYDLVHWIRGHGNEVRVSAPVGLAEWVASGMGISGSPRRADT